MMKVRFDPGLFQMLPKAQDFASILESDLFHYRLVGAMSCYLDPETLQHCIDSAMVTPYPLKEGAAVCKSC